MSLPYRCPEFRSEHLQSPCAAKLAKIKELQEKGQEYLGTLEKCRECRGDKLDVREKEEEAVAKELKVEPGFCPEHPEEDTVLVGPGRRPVAGKIPGKCKSCAEGKRATTTPKPEAPKGGAEATPPDPPEDAPAVSLCNKCGVAPAKIDRLGRNMGVCAKCMAIRNKDQLALGHKSGYAPFNIPLNNPRFAAIKEWLEKEAEEAVRDLPQEIIYRLKLAHKAAMANAPREGE
jgi:hypothetical protein